MRYVGCILLRTDISATMRPNGVEVCTIELRPETSFSPFVGNILAVSSGEYRGSRGYGPLEANVPTLPLLKSVESKDGKRDFKNT